MTAHVADKERWSISLKDLTLGYGRHIVLRDISATLPGGKITVILGESGGGKSTLLRHIVGLQKPLAGEILVGRNNLFNLPRSEFRRVRRRMGVLFQDGALLGSLNLGQNVCLPLSQHLTISRTLLEDASSRVLKMVGLDGFEKYYPAELSGGMRKRAGLARAIIALPKVLLCDEPTSGLDPITAARMDELLLTLHHQSPEMTMVIVSHDLASMNRIADHVLVLANQGIAFDGTLPELLASRDPLIQQFLQRKSGESGTDAAPPPNPAIMQAIEKWLDS